MKTVKSANKHISGEALKSFFGMAVWLIVMALLKEYIDEQLFFMPIAIIFTISFFFLFVSSSSDTDSSGFECEDCGSESELIQNSDIYDQPILRYCKDCDVVWWLGDLSDGAG